MNLIYSVVGDGLGRQAAEQFIWTLMSSLTIHPLRNNRINSVLFNGKLPTGVDAFMWSEPQWGLSNLNNWVRWDDLINPDPFIQQNAMNEFMVRFNIPYETAIIGVNNFAALYN
jgi:hypothetical protein